MTTFTAMPKYEAYKDSGVDWIGDIPVDWDIKKLSHLFSNIGSGTTPATGNISFYDGNIPWLQTGDLTDGVINSTSKTISERALKTHSALKQYKAGSLVVAMYGATIGKVGLLSISTATNQACCVLEKTDFVDMRFAFYLFMGFKSNIVAMGYGGGQPNISQDLIRNLRFPFPNQQLQTAIANFLDEKTAKIDEAIAIKEQQIELLKERKQIIIQQAVTQGLDPTVPMKDSGVEWIGKIPAHWRLMSLRYAFEFMDHKRLPLSAIEREKKKGIYPYYGASGIIDFIDEYIFDQSLLLIAEDGANLLSKSTPLCFIATGKYWVNNHAHVLKPKFGDLVYWAELLSCFDYTVYITGAAQPKLSRDNLGGIFIPVPPLSELENITKCIENIKPAYNQNIDTLMKQISYLKEYKTTLINSAVTGKIKVV